MCEYVCMYVTMNKWEFGKTGILTPSETLKILSQKLDILITS